jgi:hypothetical protein
MLVMPDSIPNSLLAFNWLFNGTLHFDNFRNGIYYYNGQPPYFLFETLKGHLNSPYPIGSAIVSFPIYFCFYIFLLLTQGAQAVDITSLSFSEPRLLFERIAAATIASFSVVLFYQLSRIKFARSIALISTFIYAFATNVWVIASQGLWQHGSTNLVLLAIVLCLFKVNRTQGKQQKLLLLSAGILCGFLIAIRPTNLAFFGAICVYSIWKYRWRSSFLFLGLCSLLINVAWNLYYFGTPLGGYTGALSVYHFAPRTFLIGMSGLLFSPSRGLLIYTPILASAVPGWIQIIRQSRHKDEKLLILLFGSSILVFFQYCVFLEWWGGGAYGPRFLTDLLPILCFSINYTIADFLKTSTSLRGVNWKVLGFSMLLSFSVFVQIVGAFGACGWDGLPIRISSVYISDRSRDKLWQIRDSQIERSFWSLMFRITQPTRAPHYAEGLAGKVLQLRDQNKQPFSSQSLTEIRSYQMRIYATVQNTGTSQWFGYQTGAQHLGEARVRVSILDALGQPVGEQRLFVSGQPKAGEIAIALGSINMPSQPGRYTFNFSLIAEQMKSLPIERSQSELSTASLVIDVVQSERGI